MQSKMIPLSEAMPGMLVAEPIRNLKTGLIYVGESQELTPEIIQKLDYNGIDEIRIFVNTWDDVWQISKDTKEEYVKCTTLAKTLLDQIAYDNVVDFVAFKEVKEQITKHFSDNYKMIGCINLFKAADSYTYTHSINVALLSTLIGKWLKLGNQAIDNLMLAGLFHDIGKMRIDKSILNKPDKLTDAEFEEIKKHPVYSYEMLGDRFDDAIRDAVRHHHEKLDGSGYPDGLKGNQISLYARITALSDIYDAMISERSYKGAVLPFQVFDMFYREEFQGLDRKLVMLFLKHIRKHFVYSRVIMSDGTVAYIRYIPVNDAVHPLMEQHGWVRQTDDIWYCKEMLTLQCAKRKMEENIK